jgi:hypothetical protein
MQDDEFEWDDAKAAANYAKHRVRFETASRVFNDPLFWNVSIRVRAAARNVLSLLAWWMASYWSLSTVSVEGVPA